MFACLQVISTLQNLQTLDLEGNELGSTESLNCELSSSISKLSHLQCLNLAACQLAQVPSPVAEHLGALRILDLTNNRWAQNLTQLLKCPQATQGMIALLEDCATIICSLSSFGWLQQCNLSSQGSSTLTASAVQVDK